MREILFRGKRVDNGKWIYGYYWLVFERHQIKALQKSNTIGCSDYEVIPETVGQFTGLTDKNDTKIFEGDIVYCVGGEYWLGNWEFSKFVEIKDIRDLHELDYGIWSKKEVIGNIHERRK